MTALTNKHYSGCHKATEEEDDQQTPEKEICGQPASGSAGGRWRWQHRTKLGGDKWSVVYDTLQAKRHEQRRDVMSYYVML